MKSKIGVILFFLGFLALLVGIVWNQITIIRDLGLIIAGVTLNDVPSLIVIGVSIIFLIIGHALGRDEK